MVATPRYRSTCAEVLADRAERAVLGVGLRRSYGDSVLNTGGALIDMTCCDRIIAFDPVNGILKADAGLSFDAGLRAIVPRGWFFATTPGTRFVTLGGAVANDVHGKNHHTAGSFGCSVRKIGLLRSDGIEHVLDAEAGGDLFRATIGGLGLTGLITWVEVQLAPISSVLLRVERIPFSNVTDFFTLAKESETFEHTVAWIDCANAGTSLGRGIFQRADWAAEGGLMPHPATMGPIIPLDAPSFALNSMSIRAFNAIYFRQQCWSSRITTHHYGQFFYPLDTIGHWNRLYGRDGLYQYQCVIPGADVAAVIITLVRAIANAAAGSFLAVLKTLGPRRSPGLISFPLEGATLALDFANRGQETLKVLARLDAIVADAGGRLYPAKDGRMPAAMFRTGYADTIDAFKAQVDPAFMSNFWRRVSA